MLMKYFVVKIYPMYLRSMEDSEAKIVEIFSIPCNYGRINILSDMIVPGDEERI